MDQIKTSLEKTGEDVALNTLTLYLVWINRDKEEKKYEIIWRD